MDIFTTQLTQVVPIPIKTHSLKVKALVKEAETSKLTEDPDHLENHDYYFSESETKQEQHKGSFSERLKEQDNETDKSQDTSHLDIFV